jgi:hypothetical protein
MAKTWDRAVGGFPKLEVCLGSSLVQQAKGATKSHSVYYREGWSSILIIGGHGGDQGESWGWCG